MTRRDMIGDEGRGSGPGIGSPTPVLFVHHGLDWITGSERCLLDLVAGLDRARFTPIVWCDAPALLRAASELGATTYQSPDWATRSSFLPNREDVRAARELMRRHGVRLVHANDTEPLRVLVAAARSERVPVVAHLHLMLTREERRWSWLHQASFAVGVSDAALRGLLDDGYPEERTAVIHNGVDPARLAGGDARGLRASLGVAAGDVVFGVVGSLIARKGIDVVIRALKAVRAGRADCHVLVCGDGPLAGDLRALAASEGVDGAVHFLGRRPDVGAVLRDATDVLVSAAREESFGLAVAEASSLGVPAIATAIDGHAEVVEDGVTGVLVPAGDVGALASAMTALAADPARRRELGAAARHRAAERFSVTRYVSEFAALYDRLLGRPPAAYGWGGPWGRSAMYTRWAVQTVGRRLARLRPASRVAGTSSARREVGRGEGSSPVRQW